ncbi:MAG: YceD family protein [Bacilli bacterium]|jgi:uncharacterized metal-binding protein YceD (DUF177 family)|nr:YceD family protein [Bacilli bacterium]HHU24608.1 hypothetical protein [Acholeplasmataceae bacterium]
MKWTLGQLRKLPESYDFCSVMDFTKESESIDDILAIKGVKVEGTITRKNLDSFYLSLTIDADLVLACAKTLEPVDYPMHLEIEEWHGIEEDRLEEEDYYWLEKNTLNLDEIVWSAILINKPIRVIHKDAEEILAKQGITFDGSYPDDEISNE